MRIVLVLLLAGCTAVGPDDDAGAATTTSIMTSAATVRCTATYTWSTDVPELSWRSPAALAAVEGTALLVTGITFPVADGITASFQAIDETRAYVTVATPYSSDAPRDEAVRDAARAAMPTWIAWSDEALEAFVQDIQWRGVVGDDFDGGTSSYWGATTGSSEVPRNLLRFDASDGLAPGVEAAWRAEPGPVGATTHGNETTWHLAVPSGRGVVQGNVTWSYHADVLGHVRLAGSGVFTDAASGQAAMQASAQGLDSWLRPPGDDVACTA